MVRAEWGIDGGVDPCSYDYRSGYLSGKVWGVATFGVGSLSGGSLIWSGTGSQAAAEALGGTVGNSTLTGWVLQTMGVNNAFAWNVASSIYAMNISGTATAVIGSAVRPEATIFLEQAILNLRAIPTVVRTIH
jgi:hypothetical protein